MQLKSWLWAGLAGCVLTVLSGCSTHPIKQDTLEHINAEMTQAAKVRPASESAATAALIPPLQVQLPKSVAPVEQRFDLVLSNAPAQQVFMAIVAGTPYSMLVHPDVSGTISVNLHNVTVREALDSIRDMYGYDYTISGQRILVQPLTMQTRVYHINYLAGTRKGSSDLRVISGSVSDTVTGPTSPTATTPGASPATGATRSAARDASKITTSSTSDFWGELKAVLDGIVGQQQGSTVVVSPQASMVVVRAMPAELRQVGDYLKAAQLVLDRQVILEAKILEVQLNDSYQSGINWASLYNGQFRAGVGVNGAGIRFPDGMPASNVGISDMLASGLPGVTPISSAAGMFGLALRTTNFVGLMQFLETQGTVHVLSSPRISSLNNQKAVLKVGTDEFFVTNVSTTTTTSTTGNVATPSVTLQSFFSGIALDVTPQIDGEGNVILHVHPSVSQVSTVNKEVNLGSTLGTINLPLASSNVSETDSVIRAHNGQVVVIGGLMRQASNNDRSQVPVVGDVPVFGQLFKHTAQTAQKRELVILLKPTVIENDADWAQDIAASQQRMQALGRPIEKPTP